MKNEFLKFAKDAAIPYLNLLFNDLEYSFKLSFLNRFDELERPLIEEYFQRSFGIDISDAKVINVGEWKNNWSLLGEGGRAVQFTVAIYWIWK